MRLAIADPPYPGCAHLYRDHPDYAGEVDHRCCNECLAQWRNGDDAEHEDGCAIAALKDTTPGLPPPDRTTPANMTDDIDVRRR